MLSIGDDTEENVPAKLRPLIHAFLSSPFNAAPEGSPELKRICAQREIKIHFKADTPDWVFEELHMFEFRRIKVGSRTIERIWAYCFAYTAITTELRKAAKGLGRIENNAEYELGFYLLKWASQRFLQDVESEWPDFLPDPSHIDVLEHVEAANHYFLMTSGRLLLHEIAHMVLPHHTAPGTPPEIQKSEEMEADRWADSWMLNKWTEYNPAEEVFTGRCMGIAFAHVPSLILGAERTKPSESHPSPIERIKEFVELWLPGGIPSDKRAKDEPCASLLVIIGHILHEKGIQFDWNSLHGNYAEVFESFKPYFP